MRRHLGVVLTMSACAAWIAVPCWAQGSSGQSSSGQNSSAQGSSSSQSQGSSGSGPAPCSVAPEPQPCGTTPAAPASKPNTMQKFPFPGEAGALGPSTGSSSTPNLSGLPSSPDGGSSSSPAAKKDAAKEFPFPGEAGTPATPEPGGPTSSSSSSDSSSSSSSDAATPADAGGTPVLTDKGSEGSETPGRHILHRVNPVGTKLQTSDERLQEDIDVAHFYMDNGDLQGAYLRGQDAIKVGPDDPEAHFTLAEVALKLNKKDEAIAEYNACLKLDPTDKEAKDARKALAKLK